MFATIHRRSWKVSPTDTGAIYLRSLSWPTVPLKVQKHLEFFMSAFIHHEVIMGNTFTFSWIVVFIKPHIHQRILQYLSTKLNSLKTVSLGWRPPYCSDVMIVRASPWSTVLWEPCIAQEHTSHIIVQLDDRNGTAGHSKICLNRIVSLLCQYSTHSHKIIGVSHFI